MAIAKGGREYWVPAVIRRRFMISGAPNAVTETAGLALSSVLIILMGKLVITTTRIRIDGWRKELRRPPRGHPRKRSGTGVT